jgi:hypothetical protein
MGLDLFRDHVIAEKQVQAKAIKAMLAQIDTERCAGYVDVSRFDAY